MSRLREKVTEQVDDFLSNEALALIEHIGKILAEEYVQLLKESESNQKGKSDESSSVCKVLK